MLPSHSTFDIYYFLGTVAIWTNYRLASSGDAYSSMCSSLLSRMLDTVPSGTNLVDVTPIPVKPTGISLTVDNSGTMTFKGYIRVRVLHLSMPSGIHPLP